MRFRWRRLPDEPAGSVVRVCTLTAGGKVALADRPEPQAAGTIVKIQVQITPMCTEFKDRRARTASDVLGHEATGVVVDPAGSKLVRAGDRVVVMPGNACGHCQVCAQGDHIYCRSPRDVLAETGSAAGTAAYADYMIKPDWLLLRIPADISLKHGSLACCGLGPGLSAMLRMRVTGQDTVLVSGCGPVGLGAISHAVARGARVIAVEPGEYRARLALRLGAAAAADPRNPDFPQVIQELTGGRGVTCAVETSGILAAPAQVLSVLQPLGRMAFLAWNARVQLPPLVPHGVEIHGCWHWNHIRDAAAMWAMIRRSPQALDVMVTHEFGLREAAQAMDLQDTGHCGKVLLHAGQDDAAA